APPLERFGATELEPTWIVGPTVGVAARPSATWTFEGRLGVHASFWPASLGRRWGATLDVESGYGEPADTTTFTGTLIAYAVRAGIGARTPIARAVVLEPSLGGTMHLVSLAGTVLAEAAHISILRLDGALEPRVALSIGMLGGQLQISPWVGLTLLTRWQRFL